MNKLKKNILLIIAVIVLIASGVVYIYLGNKEQEDIEMGFVEGKIAYNNIEDYQDGIMIATKNDGYLIIDVNDKVIEKLDEKATDVKILYGGYYSYKIGGKTYLNHNGTNIKTFDDLFLNDITLYKDQNVEDSEYITLDAKKIKDHIYYASLKVDDGVKTIIYNSKTGKKLYQTDNYISLLKLPEEEEYNYFVVGNKELVSLDKFKSIFKETDVNIIGDVNQKEATDDIISNNSKYLVVNNNTSDDMVKYGLIDLEGNVSIPLNYEDINFKSNSSRYIAAKRDGKYGLVNASNEELLPFEYEAIEVYNNHIVLVKDNYLGIMNNELELVYDYKLGLADKEYDSRENSNSFSATVYDENLIVNSYPKNEEDDITFSNSIIVDNKNEVKTFQKQNIKYIYDKNEVIDSKYLINENVDDKTLTLNIYDMSGDQISTYETVAQDSIKSVGYELCNEEYLLITLYDNDYKSVYRAIVDVKSGKVLYENDEIKNYIKKQILVDGYYFYGKENKITIKDSNNKTIMNIDGKDIKYLYGKYYAIKRLDDKYYICQVLLTEDKK